jgi:hypothetical protein
MEKEERVIESPAVKMTSSPKKNQNSFGFLFLPPISITLDSWRALKLTNLPLLVAIDELIHDCA